MYTSEFLRAQPVADGFEPFLEVDQRGAAAIEPLLHHPEQGVILRHITDLDKTPSTDPDSFTRRVNLLRELCDVVPSAHFLPYLGPLGGVVLSEVVDGVPLNRRVHDLREGITKADKAQVIGPVQIAIKQVCRYYVERIPNSMPIVVDALKSDQWVVGRTPSSPKIRPLFTDHDAHVVVPDEDYSEYDRLVIADLVSAQASALAMFLDNVGKLPELRRPNLFKPATDALMHLLYTIAEADIEPESAGLQPTAIMFEITKMSLGFTEVRNSPMLAMRDIHDKVVEARTKLEAKKRESAKI